MEEGFATKRKKFLLVDGHGVAFRGFYALPGMNAPDGTPTNAVLGFFNMLLKAVEEWRPDGVGLFFDPKGPTARDEMFGAYKEGRRPTAEGFKAQLPHILGLAAALGYPVFVRGGTEADDMIASTAASLASEGMEALIFSADKDLLQVLRGGITMARPSKGVSEFKLYDERIFREEYGFDPPAMADYLALVGDSVDNIPGVRGIGDKTARALIAEHGSLDAIYGSLDSVPGSARSKLDAGRESAYMSRSLIVPLAVEPANAEELIMAKPDSAEATRILERLGLKKLRERLGLDEPRVQPEAAAAASAANAAEAGAWDEIFSEDTLTLTGESDRLTTRDGKWKSLAPGDMPRLLEWAKPEGRRLALDDYRAHCERRQPLRGIAGRVWDVALARYFFHPDLPPRPAPDDAGGILNMWDGFARDERAMDMLWVMENIDAQLVPVLIALNRRGLLADLDALLSLDSELASRISLIEREIFSISGGILL
jgi:DNA polymerase-1